MIRIKSDKIICGDSIFDGYIYIEKGKISSLSKEEKGCEECYDFTGKYVSPGFIELHTHGGGGYSFSKENEDDIIQACNFHLKHGATTILPTLSAGPIEDMKSSVEVIKKAKASGKIQNNLYGVHMEGPYLSKNQSGAQNTDYITPPVKEDYEKLVNDYSDIISRWTYAPENDSNGEFCRYITSHGIIASAGHTDAKYPDMQTAFENGCKLVTHLYSCTSSVTRTNGFRSCGVIESAYLNDDMFVEIIADGKHLPKELVQMIVKIKGEDRVALISDSLDIAGTDIKSGCMNGVPFIVEDGVCKLSDRSAFAGSIATSDILLKFCAYECGFGIIKAVKMMTRTPAEILGVNKGAIASGYDADIVVFDESINISSAFVGGRKVSLI